MFREKQRKSLRKVPPVRFSGIDFFRQVIRPQADSSFGLQLPFSKGGRLLWFFFSKTLLRS
jgi:hypothetical protein